MVENKKKYFENFVLNYSPFSWEIKDYDDRPLFKDKHSFLTSYKRFYKVFTYILDVMNNLNSKTKILDIGSYPGNMIKLSQNLFKEKLLEYTALGLSFDEKFITEVKKYNVNCIDTEIDPSFPYAKTSKNWGLVNYDLAYLLDTIEHLVDPTFCLDQINKSLKKNGYLIITTDNITNFLYIQDMLRKGKSPNVPFVLSSKVYSGDWRPHDREYSKDELIFLLEYSGFKVIKHEYFDRKQGEYKFNSTKSKIIDHKIKWGVKHGVFLAAKYLAYCVPHLRNHHILVAQKNKNLEEVGDIRKTTDSLEEWLKIRKLKIGY